MGELIFSKIITQVLLGAMALSSIFLVLTIFVSYLIVSEVTPQVLPIPLPTPIPTLKLTSIPVPSSIPVPILTLTPIVTPASTPLPVTGIVYEQKTVEVSQGSFFVDLLKVDLGNPAISIVTDTAITDSCSNNCPTFPLSIFVQRNNGVAGFHGTYFCPAEYSSCEGQSGSYHWMVWNTNLRRFINEDRNTHNKGALFVFDTKNNVYFFQENKTFKDMTWFEETYQAKIQAAISCGPALTASGRNVVGEAPEIDVKQLSAKGSRGGIGVKGKTLYLVATRSATVIDLASIFEALGVESALNLDGGGSTALFYQGEYKVGPGRNIANAIVIRSAN